MDKKVFNKPILELPTLIGLDFDQSHQSSDADVSMPSASHHLSKQRKQKNELITLTVAAGALFTSYYYAASK